MLSLGLLGKKKPQTSSEAPPEPVVTNRLQDVAAGDTEMYLTLLKTLFLEPKRISTTLEELVSQAGEFESKGDLLRAEVSYRIAGGISLYRGDPAGVRKYFDKASSMAKNSRPEYNIMTRRAEDAVAIARKYYENL